MVLVMRGATALAALCLAAPVLAGCGDDEGDGDRADTVDTTTTTVEQETDDDAEQPSVDPRAALLTLEDLPAGYSTSPEDDDEDPPLESCEQLQALEDDNIEPLQKAEAEYQASRVGPIIEHQVSVLDEGRAEQIFEDFAEAIDNPECRTLRQETDDGETATYEVSPLSSPRLGDETLAFRLTGDEVAFSITLDFLVERIGDSVSFLAVGSIPTGGPAPPLEPLARRADEKLRAA